MATVDLVSTTGYNPTDSSLLDFRRLCWTGRQAAEACHMEHPLAETATERTAKRQGSNETKNAYTYNRFLTET